MLDEMDENRWQETIDVNLTGVWKTVKAGVRHIKAGGRGGSVILTSSVGGIKGYQHVGHYVSAKHGVVGLMRTLALPLGAAGGHQQRGAVSGLRRGALCHRRAAAGGRGKLPEIGPALPLAR
jgi:NAD(P)-dependent dehydrogenase (short-subunit alcohol dehydrogenase family)